MSFSDECPLWKSHMTRLFLPALLLILAVGACNPSDPTGPQEFSLFDIYGLWKLQMEGQGCAPGDLVNLEFGPFGVAATEDSKFLARLANSWGEGASC